MKKISIISYDPLYKADFARLNKQWIEKNFILEPIDIKVLDHPEEDLLNLGGEIFFALDENQKCVGTAALKKMSSKKAELVKMAVDESMQGQGVGHQLMQACLDGAKKMGFESLLIISNTSLKPAIHIYKKFGFEVRQIGAKTDYERGDIVLDLQFNKI